jgi:hypothetical protein
VYDPARSLPNSPRSSAESSAIAAHARIIVSGDHDLLDLGTFGDIRFLTASSALALLDR